MILAYAQKITFLALFSYIFLISYIIQLEAVCDNLIIIIFIILSHVWGYT
jgi:hypothetical protein